MLIFSSAEEIYKVVGSTTFQSGKKYTKKPLPVPLTSRKGTMDSLFVECIIIMHYSKSGQMKEKCR